MNIFTRIIWGLLLCLGGTLNAQIIIDSQLPASESVSVCEDSASISFNISANGISATSISLEIDMPQGINYVDNSLQLTTVSSKSVSFVSWTNQRLSLSAQDISGLDSLSFSFDFYANCEVLDFFQSATTFRDTLAMKYNGTEELEHITNAMNNSITYPELSVLVPSTPIGNMGDTITREVKIFNAKSCVSSFDWYDAFQSDVRVDSILLNGTKLNISYQNDTAFYTFGPGDFALIGNNDGEFCEDELNFTIVEYLTLTGCDNKASVIGVSWGCDNVLCQSYYSNTDVSLGAESPELSFTWRNNTLPE